MEFYWLHSKLSDPLEISRSGVSIPEIFWPPAGNLVVSAMVQASLHDLPNIHFLEVKFKKLVDFYVCKGDRGPFEQWVTAGKGNPETLIAELPDIPLMHKNVGQYYEMIVARDVEIREQLQCDSWIELEAWLPKTTVMRHFCATVCIKMFEEFPICYVKGHLVCESRAFQKLKPFLDRDYFDVTPLNI